MIWCKNQMINRWVAGDSVLDPMLFIVFINDLEKEGAMT